MQSKSIKANFMLLLTAMIWGAAFVAQDVGMEHVGPFTFNATRMLLGSITLVPVIAVMALAKRRHAPHAHTRPLIIKEEWLGGLICGFILFAASALQQVGISMYSDSEAAAGKTGFITALYIVIVPVIGVALGKKNRLTVWLGIALALVGMYLLCSQGGFSIAPADFLVFLCALAFALHILVIDYYSPKVDGIKMSAIQFFTAGVLALICMLLFETPTISGIRSAAVPIVYAGVLSCAVAYTMQVVAQKNTNPTLASILMSLESVFAALVGALFGERLTAREIIGCCLMFAAVILAQVDVQSLQIKRKV